MRKLTLVYFLAGLLTNVCAPAEAAQSITLRDRTLLAEVYFYGGDEAGCVFTDMIVVAWKGNQRSSHGVKEGASWFFVGIQQYDICGGNQNLNIGASGELQPGEFTVQNATLASATVRKVIEAYDYLNETPVSLTVDLSWRALYPPTRGHGTFSFRDPASGYSFHARTSGVTRLAEVTGIVSDGTINYTDLAPVPSIGDIQSVRSGTVTIIH